MMKLNTKFQLKLTFKKTFLFYLLTIIVVFSSCENQKDSDMTQEQLLAMAKEIEKSFGKY